MGSRFTSRLVLVSDSKRGAKHGPAMQKWGYTFDIRNVVSSRVEAVKAVSGKLKYKLKATVLGSI
jgi:hypothetical protein